MCLCKTKYFPWDIYVCILAIPHNKCKEKMYRYFNELSLRVLWKTLTLYKDIERVIPFYEQYII